MSLEHSNNKYQRIKKGDEKIIPFFLIVW